MSHSASTPMMTPEQSYIASVVTTHVFISISMVYLNKTLMSSASVSIPAPLFVTWFQCVVTALICYVCGEVGDRMKKIEYHSVSTNASESDSNNANKNEKGSSKSFWLQFPRAEYHIIQGQRVLPLSLVFVGMITFNNLCKYVAYSESFYFDCSIRVPVCVF
jgi:solute carrier family 35 (GDP-fucose transporter), member C1